MATISERLAYVLTFDTSSGVKSLEKFGSTADKQLGKADQRLDKLGANMSKFGAGAMAFAGVAGAGLFKLASGAADAQANMSALEQVVGETVAQDVGKWAEDSALGVGLASKDAVGAATSFAQLGKIIGLGGQDLSKFSTDLVTLSADFAAFKNVSPDQALQDIQAGFAGSTEVMRKYGIFLDDATLKTAYFRETGERVTGTLTAQQKIVAINSELYRQGADMLGQWGRESGELAGQQAILKAELTNLGDRIGAGVLPMMVSLMGTATQVATAFGSINDATAGMVGKIAGITVAVAALGGGLLFATGKLIQFRRHLHDVATNVSPRMAAAMGVAGVAILGLGLYAKDAADDARKLTSAIGELSRASDAEILDNFNKALLQSVTEGNGVNKMLDELVRTQLGAAERIVATAKAKGEETEITKLLEKAIAAELDARDNAAASTEAETAAVEANTEAIDDNARKYIEHAKGMQREADKTARANEEATARIEAAWDSLNEELSDRSAYLDIQDALADVEAAYITAMDTADKSLSEQEQDARNLERSVIDLKGKVNNYAQEIALLPPEFATDIQALIDEGAYAEVERRLAKLERVRTTRIAVQNAAPSSYVPPTSYDGPRARGGPVSAGGTYLVGEEGPELLQMGSQSGNVIPNGATVGMGGGPVFNVTINADPNPDVTVRKLREFVRRNGPIQGIT